MLEITFAAPKPPTEGALALLLHEGAGVAGEPIAHAIDEQTGGALAKALSAAEFTGKRGSTVTLFGIGGLSRIVAVGLGKADDLKPRHLEETGGHVAVALAREARGTVAGGALTAEQAASVAMGATLRGYRFDRYRTKEKAEDKPRLAGLTILTAADAQPVWAPQRAVAEGVFLTRDLVSEPANILSPAELAERCRNLSSLGLEVDVVGPEEMKELGFGALLGVAQGSANEPRMVTMTWRGGAVADKPLAFIGKGVTFDTGGISIKPAGGMEDMKFDMAGAGAVIGLMAALAGRKAKANVIGLVGLVENMLGPNAQRPGDVVTTASGQTVEVINTDAEGRLVLADVLWHCQKVHDPRFMIDLATLTGAMIISLGHERAGFFTNTDELADRLFAAGEATDEKLWRMPLGEAYDKMIKSDIADMKNVGGREGGAISAAQFIKRFVNDKPWAHLDIAGTAWARKDHAVVPKGASGYGVRLLDRFVAEYYES